MIGRFKSLYYLLTRRQQVTVFRLRTGHNRLNYHLYSKLRIGHTEQCPCGTGSQTTEHLLQFCPTYEPLRKGIWPDHTPLARKLYGSLRDLRCTATFIGETGISIWRTRRRRRNPFETDTTGRLFVVDVSVNWPSNRNCRTKVLDSWKVTQRIYFIRKVVIVGAGPFLSVTLPVALTLIKQQTSWVGRKDFGCNGVASLRP